MSIKYDDLAAVDGDYHPLRVCVPRPSKSKWLADSIGAGDGAGDSVDDDLHRGPPLCPSDTPPGIRSGSPGKTIPDTHQYSIISNVMGSDGLPFSVRRYDGTDRNLVLHSWIQNAQRWSKLRAGYARAAEVRIKKLLEGEGRAVVACSRKEPARVFGWAVAQGPVLHFVYVKRALRRQGIGASLLQALGLDKRPICVSHWTQSEEPDRQQFVYVGFP